MHSKCLSCLVDHSFSLQLSRKLMISDMGDMVGCLFYEHFLPPAPPYLSHGVISPYYMWNPLLSLTKPLSLFFSIFKSTVYVNMRLDPPHCYAFVASFSFFCPQMYPFSYFSLALISMVLIYFLIISFSIFHTPMCISYDYTWFIFIIHLTLHFKLI